MRPDPEKRVPCGICGLPTVYRGTARCDRCWELERRIETDPEIARRILDDRDARPKR